MYMLVRIRGISVKKLERLFSRWYVDSKNPGGNPHRGPEYGPPYILATETCLLNDQQIQNSLSPSLSIRAFTERVSSLDWIILAFCILEYMGLFEWHSGTAKKPRLVETELTQAIFMLTSPRVRPRQPPINKPTSSDKIPSRVETLVRVAASPIPPFSSPLLSTLSSSCTSLGEEHLRHLDRTQDQSGFHWND